MPLAYGAGAPIDSPYMAANADGMAQRGWRVVRFEFPYMARQRSTGRRHGPDRLPVLQEALREQGGLERADTPGRPLILAGKSMGGRVASGLADPLATGDGVLGCLCLGYPFHPPGRPLQQLTDHLAGQRSPTLILQGERDSFGCRDEVERYTSSAQVQVGWIPAGGHSFRPTRRSGRSEEENWAMAVDLSDRFLRQRLKG